MRTIAARLWPLNLVLTVGSERLASLWYRHTVIRWVLIRAPDSDGFLRLLTETLKQRVARAPTRLVAILWVDLRGTRLPSMTLVRLISTGEEPRSVNVETWTRVFLSL